MLGWKVNPKDEQHFPSIQEIVGAIDFLAAQQGEQHFRITDIVDITGENITVENYEIGKFSDARGFKAAKTSSAFSAEMILAVAATRTVKSPARPKLP
jgi:hypothetical protein